MERMAYQNSETEMLMDFKVSTSAASGHIMHWCGVCARRASAECLKVDEKPTGCELGGTQWSANCGNRRLRNRQADLPAQVPARSR